MPSATSIAPSSPAAPQLTLREVFVAHAAFVLRVLRRMGVAQQDVEDVAQEVFVVVQRKLDTFDGTSSVRTWLFAIAMRVASDQRRKAHVRREQLTSEWPAVSVPAQQHEEVRRRELRAKLDRALDALSEDKRAVFVLYEMEGVPMAEIAQSLGCPLNTGYSRLREARERMRAFFEQAELQQDTP